MKRVFHVGLMTNLPKVISEAGKEVLQAMNVEGDVVQKYAPIYEVTLHKDVEWTPGELKEVRLKIKALFTVQYSDLLIHEHIEFYVDDSKGDIKINDDRKRDT